MRYPDPFTAAHDRITAILGELLAKAAEPSAMDVANDATPPRGPSQEAGLPTLAEPATTVPVVPGTENTPAPASAASSDRDATATDTAGVASTKEAEGTPRADSEQADSGEVGAGEKGAGAETAEEADQPRSDAPPTEEPVDKPTEKPARDEAVKEADAGAPPEADADHGDRLVLASAAPAATRGDL